MAVQILEKRRLLADQISFIIQGLEESVDQLQQKYDKIAPKYRKNIDEKRKDFQHNLSVRGNKERIEGGEDTTRRQRIRISKEFGTGCRLLV